MGTGSFTLPATGGLTSFGTNPLQPGLQQQSLVATVDKNPYGNNPLFDLNKPLNPPAKSGPSAVAVEGSHRKAQGPLYPMSPRVVSKIKLRGFSHHPTNSNSFAAKHTKTNARTSSLEGISDDAVLGAGAFAPRPSNKKLVFGENVDAANIGALVNKKVDNAKRKIRFDPQLEFVASQENTADSTTPVVLATTTTTAKTTTTTTTTVTNSTITEPSSSSISTLSSQATKSGYYISPSLETLASMPKEGLKQIQNLVVGRKGFGEIRFEQSVDLSEIDLEDIMGQLIVIEDKAAVVYPDQDKKPPKGTGLNVPAIVKLEQCFSRDKNTGAPIRDPEHPRFKLFKDKLQKRSGTDFVDYEDATGNWTFKIHEF
ncbi:nucleoporin autopeptidase-domain-containing protein [Choanephora cucurbitarum]|nr:nucleoporin autopeptidase-domain-containing protein [Choanephora cucurbitarum]